ncbi:hypothetical protein [Salicola sp. Rm-C-2C1-2]
MSLPILGDITYIRTGAGFLYLTIILNVFSRRVVGWAMAAPRSSKASIVR